MINLLNLSKFILSISFFIIFICDFSLGTEPVDIWKENENKDNLDIEEKNKSEFKSLILINDTEGNEISVSEANIELERDVVGLFDPEENNFDLNMWVPSDGMEVKKVFNRINKLKLSKFSHDLLFKVLFTNSYPPQKNLSTDEFLDIKIEWLIQNEKVKDLENLLLKNIEVGEKPKAIKFLIEEYISSGNIKSACEKTKLVNKNVKNNYLEKFNIYCLIYENRKNEAQLLFDLLKERGFKDKFYENKINYLLGYTKKTSGKIIDNDLFNFYLSQITIKDFNYKPGEKTSKYIWRYLTAANLIQIENFEDEATIKTYETAASNNSYGKKEIFNIYKNILFNINQLVNAEETYKTLPSYKSRALIYQKILLSDNIEKKLNLAFLLKDLFEKDNLSNVYSEEFINILTSIDKKDIPKNYAELVQAYSEKGLEDKKKIKFDNEIIHKSKILKYFLEDGYSEKKVEKDLNSVYKKIKKNKKYFISIKDIAILESLENDGIVLPDSLNLNELSSRLTIPEGLNDLTEKNQVGLTMLKIVEIVGEDKIEDLDPETIYFLIKILNKLELKKIRNRILITTFPERA